MIALRISLLLVCLSACGPSGGGGDKAAPQSAPSAAQAPAPAAQPESATAAPAAASDAPAEAAPATGEVAQAPDGAVVEPSPQEQVQAIVGGQLQPANAPQPPSVPIPDIDKHRSGSLAYVRGFDNRVKLDIGPIDIDADPVATADKRKISKAAFQRRALLYSGEAEVDRHITYLLTETEAQRAIAAGADPALFAVSDADVDRKFEELKEFVAMQARQQPAAGADPAAADAGQEEAVKAALDYYMQTIESSIGMEKYRAYLAADARFERVFLPFPEGKVEGTKLDPATTPPSASDPRPTWLPQATWDALAGNEQALMLRTFVANWAIDGEPVPAMFRANILTTVRDGLVANTGVKFFFDEELPDGVLLRVGDHMVKTEDIWPLVRPTIADADVDLILRELLMLDGMRAALEASDRWFDDAEFAVEWKAENDKYVGTFIPLKNMIMFRGYSSLDRYREHYRYRQAYYKWRRETLTDAEVMEHYQGGGRLFFERGAIVVDLAYAPLKGRPFTQASLEACRQELAEAIEAARSTDDGTTPAGETPGWWKSVAERFPPPPAREGMDAHALQRSQLRLNITEDELSIFLAGYSLADDAFYHGHRGDVYGPVAMSCRRHAWGAESNAGAWAVYIRDFSRRQTLQPFEGTNKDLAYEDFLDLNYFNWSAECLQALLPKGKKP